MDLPRQQEIPFYKKTTATEIYSLSLHDTLPISLSYRTASGSDRPSVNADALTKHKAGRDRKSTRLNSSHVRISYAVFCLKKNKFRTYGTWLHGDARGAVDRFHQGYCTPRLPLNSARKTYEEDLLKQTTVILDSRQRAAVESGVRETCTIRKWSLWALNVRTNHVHAVVSANRKPETILNALKANATGSMRDDGCWRSGQSPWTYRGSKKYLWIKKRLPPRSTLFPYTTRFPSP